MQVDVANDRSVELDESGRTRDEREQARVTGAEVVDRELNSLVREVSHDRFEPFVVLDRLLLRYLQDDRTRSIP